MAAESVLEYAPELSDGVGQIIVHELGHLFNLSKNDLGYVDTNSSKAPWYVGSTYCIMDYANSTQAMLTDDLMEFSTKALSWFRDHADPVQ